MPTDPPPGGSVTDPAPYRGELTDQQVSWCAAAREGWLRAALTTERCDRPAAEAAVRAVYASAGLPAPRTVLWMDSPLGGAAAAAVLGSRVPAAAELLGEQLAQRIDGRVATRIAARLPRSPVAAGEPERPADAGRLWDRLRTRLNSHLGAGLAERLWTELDAQFDGEQLGGRLWGTLSGPLRAQIVRQVAGGPTDVVRRRLVEAVDPWTEASPLARYGCAFRIAGLPVAPRLSALDAAVRRTGWWWPLPEVAVLTDRPTAVHRDEQGRPHGEAGPALAYADGVAVHSWHGTTVPADLVEGDGWPADRILAEPDPDVRRCAVERRGWDRFVRDAGLAQVGPTEPDPGNPGRTLRLHDVPAAIYGAPVRVLICENGSPDRDGTRRRFGLPVPADVPDPVSAAAWTYGLDRAEYARVQRRT